MFAVRRLPCESTCTPPSASPEMLTEEPRAKFRPSTKRVLPSAETLAAAIAGRLLSARTGTPEITAASASAAVTLQKEEVVYVMPSLKASSMPPITQP